MRIVFFHKKRGLTIQHTDHLHLTNTLKISKMNSILRCITLLAALVNVAQAAEFTVTFGKCNGSTEVLDITDAVFTCDGSCTWGSTATVAATVEIGETFADYDEPYVTASLMGYEFLSETMDVCEYAGIEDCQAVAGNYTIETDLTVPDGSDHWASSIANAAFGTAEAKIDFGNDVEIVCSANVQGAMAGYTKAAVGGVIVLAVGLIALVLLRRRRRSKNNEVSDQGAPNSSFARMV